MKQLTFKKIRPVYHEVYWGVWKKEVLIGYADTKRGIDHWRFVAHPNSPHHGGFESASFEELERKMKRYFEKHFSGKAD